ncbi:MAG: chromosomal replication initiator protein DnaA [Spirochaetaceae bacterium]|jgi:chromosomal replication initiator protein|nr:chromosomal replication initiator protein DnaA [Spirochaetaceae bacterium]
MAEWDYKVFWKETMNQIHTELGEQEFSVWFINLEYLKGAENGVTIAVPSSFYRDQIKLKYQNRIEAKLKELTGKNMTIDLEVVPRNLSVNPVPQEKDTHTLEPAKGGSEGVTVNSGGGEAAAALNTAPGKKPPHPQLREDYTFDKYVVGENNSFAANAAQAIGRNPGVTYNPFLVYGGVGLGKTHLMQAIGNYVYKNSDKKVIYISAENFLNEFVQAIAENRTNKVNAMPAFRNKYRRTDVLLIDDIQFLQGKEAIQDELFYTFNALLDAKKHVVFTCDRPVSELKKMPERLISRFDLCLKVDLQPPKFETRCAILKSIVEDQGAAIPDEVIELIGKNISSNVRNLIAALKTLIAYTELMDMPVTIEIAQQQLRDVFASPKETSISIDTIQRVVSENFSLTPGDLRGKKRTKKIVSARQLAMYLARDIGGYSTNEIGQDFGGRDHTTVMYSCKMIEEQILTDPNLDATIESLKRLIKEYNARS